MILPAQHYNTISGNALRSGHYGYPRAANLTLPEIVQAGCWKPQPAAMLALWTKRFEYLPRPATVKHEIEN